MTKLVTFVTQILNMKDRIAKIMQIKNLNATRFADELEIQRSGISHILSGRNKPSLDLVIKIKETFPEFSLDWLIFGRGPVTESQHDTPIAARRLKEPDLFDSDERPATNIDKPSVEQKPYGDDEPPKIALKTPEPSMITDNSGNIPLTGIEKIVFFYKNGRFKVYEP